jgi:hypothetical protein
VPGLVSFPRVLIDCPNCNAQVDGEVIGAVDMVGDPDAESEPRRRVSLLRCPVCGNPLVAMDVQIKTENVEFWDRAERLWPSRLALSSAVPDEIRRSLDEADICRRAGAFTASVAMTGRGLEAMRRHFQTKSQVLAGGLKELLDQDIIDKRIYQWGEELRLNRNLAVHATGETFSELEAEQLLNFAVAICDYVFVLDHKFALFKKRRADMKETMASLKQSLEERSANGKEKPQRRTPKTCRQHIGRKPHNTVQITHPPYQ